MDPERTRSNGEEIVKQFNEKDATMFAESERTKIPSQMREEQPPERMMLAFEDMSSSNVNDAVKLADEVFALEKGAAAKDFGASLVVKDGARGADSIYSHRQYWVPTDQGGRIAGTMGIYSLAADKLNHAWLGWFALRPDLQGKNLGKDMLEFTIEKARSLGKTDLYIATSEHPDMAGNAKFYYKNGCPIVAVLNSSGIHLSDDARELSQPILRGVRDYYQPFIDDGYNIMIRRRSIETNPQ